MGRAAPWRVVFAADAINDLRLISDHLIQAYQGFGESLEEASRHAAARIDTIISAAERLATAPLRGESHQRHMLVRLLQKRPEP